MRRLAAACALVLLTAAADTPASPAPVLVRLKEGRELKALRVRTAPKDMLELDLEGGGVQRLALNEVASIRFGRRAEEEVRRTWERYREKLVRIRQDPFAGREFARLLADRSDLPGRERTLGKRLEQNRLPLLAMNLAALRYAQGNLAGCKEALRLVKDLSTAPGDRNRLEEACVLLAVLQLPRTLSLDDAGVWKDCDEELTAGLKKGDQEALKDRILAIDRMAKR